MPATPVKSRIPYDGCPLCRAQERQVVAVADCSRHPLYDPAILPKITWCRCGNCGHIFTDGYFSDETLAIILQKTNESQEVGFELERQRFLSARMVEKILPFAETGAWLDIGFGNGSLLFTAQEYGFEPVGLDLRQRNVDRLRHIGIEAYLMSLEKLDQGGRFAVISMADVLEHMPFPSRSLTAARTLLQSDGVLLLSMPNADSVLWHTLNESKANPYWAEIEHYHNFGRKRLFALLKETGFEPVRFGISERYRIGMEIVACRRASEEDR